MKRVYILIGSALLAIGVIAFSLSHWNTKVDSTTEQAKEKIEEVRKKDPSLVGETIPNSNPSNNSDNSTNGNSETANNSGNDSSSSDTTDSSSQPNGTEASETTEESSNTTSTPSKGKSLEDINSAYGQVFSDLEVQVTSNLDQMLVKAKADYVSNKYSKIDLALKYQEAAKTLESNADKAFNTYFQQMQKDLERYGHDPNAAETFKNEYEVKKQERTSHLMGQLQNL
jgi:hypothetical protein